MVGTPKLWRSHLLQTTLNLTLFLLLKPIFFDKINFSGCALKFKARTNTLNLEGNKKSWSVVNTGICKMCDSNSIETTDHFIFECSALNHIRDEAYNSLREALLNNNWEVLWDTDTKQFLLLGYIFQEDYSLGNSFDTCCKYYLSHAWKTRANVYNL